MFGLCRRSNVRAREGLSSRHLRDVVDQGGHPGIHPALVSLVKMGTRQSEEAVLQPAKAKSKISALEEGDLRPIRSN